MRHLLVACLVLLTAGAANAGDNTSGSNSNSGAASYSGVNIQNGRGYRSTGTAIAPGLIASGLSCQGSVSTGVGGAGWGFAFGTTKLDRDCNIRENSKMVGLLGDTAAAREVMCNVREVREAYAMVGRPCLRDRVVTSKGNAIVSRGKVKVSKTRDPYAVIANR